MTDAPPRALTAAALTAADVTALIGRVGGEGQVLRILSGELAISVAPTGALAAASRLAERTVRVADGLAFEERVRRGGYGWRHGDCTPEHFPLAADHRGAFVHKLFHFARGIASRDAIAEILAAGYQPAGIGDILAFGENFPLEQRDHPVIGLGSVSAVEGALSVPALWFDGERRTLDLIWYDGDWHRNYRFLGVRRAGDD